MPPQIRGQTPRENGYSANSICTDLRLGAVSRLELIGGVQDMVAQTLARGDQAVEALLPALKLIIVILTTHPDPVPFKLAAQALQLWKHLGLECIVPGQVRLRQLTHDVCVYWAGDQWNHLDRPERICSWPHGIIAGTTGAGKSELLQSLIVGLAITHHPHLVNFVLVDFSIARL